MPKSGQSQKERFELVFSSIFWFSEPRALLPGFPARSPSFALELRSPSGPGEVHGCKTFTTYLNHQQPESEHHLVENRGSITAPSTSEGVNEHHRIHDHMEEI